MAHGSWIRTARARDEGIHERATVCAKSGSKMTADTGFENAKRMLRSTRQPASAMGVSSHSPFKNAKGPADQMHRHAPIGFELVAGGELRAQRARRTKGNRSQPAPIELTRCHDLACAVRDSMRASVQPGTNCG
jgi:hypothetical protein